MWLIRILYWLQAFTAPLLIFGVLAFGVYNKEEIILAIILFILGVLSGVLLAEFIRRKYGLEAFFGRIYGPGKTGRDASKE